MLADPAIWCKDSMRGNVSGLETVVVGGINTGVPAQFAREVRATRHGTQALLAPFIRTSAHHDHVEGGGANHG